MPVIVKKKSSVPAVVEATEKRKPGRPRKTDAEKAEKKARASTSVMVSELNKKQKAAVSVVSTLRAEIEEKNTELQAAYGDLMGQLGSTSFLHPELGPMCIMSRKNKVDGSELMFWRSKPVGRKAGTKAKKVVKAEVPQVIAKKAPLNIVKGGAKTGGIKKLLKFKKAA